MEECGPYGTVPLIITILVDVVSFVIFICISLMTNDIERLFVLSLAICVAISFSS